MYVSRLSSVVALLVCSDLLSYSHAEDVTAVEQFAWIPAKMFGSYCENDTPAIR